MGESTTSNRYYSPDCYIKNNKKEIQINQGFLYENNKLTKYITPQAESLVIENIDSNSDLKEYKIFKKLNFKMVENNTIELFDKRYFIERQNGDTIFLVNNIVIIKNPKTY